LYIHPPFVFFNILKTTFIYLFIHQTACRPQAMASEVQTTNREQEQQIKLNKGKTKNPWISITTPQSLLPLL
jgi:hypothetical protein